MICGVLVGGASSRMGTAKAFLSGPSGETLIERTCRVVRDAGLRAVLVGVREEVAERLPPSLAGLVRVADAAVGKGPLGGLAGMLAFANEGHVIAIACDMPHVRASTLERVWHERNRGPIVAPRRGRTWEPLLASYEVAPVLPVAAARLSAGDLGLQGLLEACGVVEVDVDPRELDDWDTLDDVARDMAARTREK